MQLDARATFNPYTIAVKHDIQQRAVQLQRIANHHCGPLPHEMRQFTIGYAESKLLYGMPLAWGCLNECAQRRIIQSHHLLQRTITSLPSSVDEDSALVEANSKPLHIKRLKRKAYLFERSSFSSLGWASRPPPEPPPRRCFRVSPITRFTLKEHIETIFHSSGLPPDQPREPPSGPSPV